MSTNEVTLTGVLSAVEPLRHTPAGLPLLEFKLAHRSQQLEGGFKRQIELEIVCVAMADVATRLSRLKSGREISVTGFLNRKNRMSAQLVLHATRTEFTEDTNHGNDEQGGPRTGQGQS